MSLNKAIKHGKERRKPYRGSKVFDHSCRNHGACGYCRSTRTYFDTKQRKAAQLDMAYFDREIDVNKNT